MTEEDTICILKRIPYCDMLNLYMSGAAPNHTLDHTEWDRFFVSYGWTGPEFSDYQIKTWGKIK